MTDDGSPVPRRRVLEALGAGGMAGLAGCNGELTPTGTDLGVDTPTVDTPTDQGGGGGGPCPGVEHVLNTGYDEDAGSTISPCNPDDDWDVTAEEVGAGAVPRDADVIQPHPAWADPFADSRWISVTCDGNPGLSLDEELFEFEFCFCLNEGFRNPRLEARLRADDAVEDVRLNGTSLPFAGNGTYAGDPVEVSTDSRRLFRAGENCLTVVIRDGGAVITGLNLAGTVTAENADCECEPGACDLGIEKTHEGTFEFGGTGTYVLEVCNEGDSVCNQAAEVQDELPPGVTFDGASGPGWNVTDNAGTLNLTHPNQGSLAPGECLPRVEIDVRVAPLEEFPAEGALENCAELVTGGQNTDNDLDCDTACVAGERTFEGGVRDGYDTSNSEPASPSAGLQANWGGNLKDFDDTAINTHFGHTFEDLRPSPVVGQICEAELEICLKPETVPLNTNDIISLGVWDADGNSVDTHWGRKLGNDGGDPGLFDTRWRPSATEGECITLDLSALPEADGSTTNLLGVLNTHNRVSLHVQDDTTVDFAHLSVRYCCDGGDGECEPTVDKRPRGEFQFGEPGSYVVEVCNEGEGTCEGPFTVTDELPQGVSFVGASGPGWQCQEQNGVVRCEHGNAGALSPGECLPAIVIEVEVGSPQEVGADRLRNCVELRHAGRVVDETCVDHGIGGGDGGGGEGCQLSLGKRVENPFEFGGAGAYGFRVCNEGDEVCEQEVVEVVDELPDGLQFEGGGGTGWTCELVDPDRQLVSCTYEGAVLEPGECLSRNVWEISVVSEEEWPHDTDTVRNCAELSTATERVDEDCVEHQVE